VQLAPGSLPRDSRSDAPNEVGSRQQEWTCPDLCRFYRAVDMAYNALNQLTSLSRFSGVNSVVDTSYTYDLNQRLIQLSHKKGASTVASYDYSYDNADKLASTVSSVDGTSSYSYDATNQLIGTDHSSQTDEAYSYDANGNRTSGGTVTGVNNQLLSDGNYSYTYDGEGNRTRRTEIATGKVTEYVWDYRNRLASVLFKDAGGAVTKTISYTYDGNNQRIGKNVDGAVERYVIDRNQIALVFDGAGNQTHRYLYGTTVDQVLADETPTGMVWALADRLGTVTDLVDNSGSVVNHITYDSFGKVQSQSNAGVGFRYGYTGREQDAETGLDYYRARYYDSASGRFISEDPIGFGAGDSNLTRYVGNSPANWVDPSGNVKIEIVHNPIVGYKNESISYGRTRSGKPQTIINSLSFGITHAFILVTDDRKPDVCNLNSKNNQRESNQKYYRGGPLIGDFEDQLKGGDSGPIVAKSGCYLPGTVDYPKDGGINQTRTVIYNNPGESPDKYDEKFQRTISRINGGNFKYHIFGPNSNTVAHQLLTDANLPDTLALGILPPGWGYDFWRDSLGKYNKNKNVPFTNIPAGYDNKLNPFYGSGKFDFNPADLKFLPGMF
jgi:RHS repeat-associated protein